MFAVLKTGGKQYCVRPGEVFVAEKITSLKKDSAAQKSTKKDVLSHTFREILCVSAEGRAHFGEPLLKQASVTVDVLDDVRSKKVLVFKKKRRNNYRRTHGHRQEGILLRVKDIILEGKSLLSSATAQKEKTSTAKAKKDNTIKKKEPPKKSVQNAKKAAPTIKEKANPPSAKSTKESKKD